MNAHQARTPLNTKTPVMTEVSVTPQSITRILAFVCALAALILSGCAINPATGKIDTVTMTRAQEVSTGRKIHEEYLKQFPVYEDPALNEYVNEIGQKMAKVSDRPDLEYVFTILDNPDINAFALPGGFIYINRGLITYLNNEAQLAAVLGHEIAHVTARHHVRRESALAGRNVGAVFAGVFTGSYTVASAVADWSNAAIAGYGRDMELEADGFGAQYLQKAGYSPDAMIDVLSLLKSHERFGKQRARESGRKVVSYHGVFASHPRSDQRLQQAVAAAKDQSSSGVLNEERFREATEGLIWGQNHDRIAKAAAEAAENNEEKENRYTHNRLGFSFLYPEDWQVSNEGSAIIAKADDQSASLTLTVARIDPKANFENLLRDHYKVDFLKRSEALSQHGLVGHTGIKVAPPAHESRVALLVHANRAYWLQGEVLQADQETDYDQLFMATIRSFEPVRPKAPAAQKAKHSQTIHYVVANENTTFARLATDLKLGQYGEQYLRLINSYYPRGEPYPGEIIKIIQ